MGKLEQIHKILTDERLIPAQKDTVLTEKDKPEAKEIAHQPDWDI